MISSVVSEILESEQQQTYEEALNIELLQLATLLVRNMTQELVDHRKVHITAYLANWFSSKKQFLN